MQSCSQISSSWIKHGEIFLDEHKKSCYICCFCTGMESLQNKQLEVKYVFNNVVNFWTHIQKYHLMDIFPDAVLRKNKRSSSASSEASTMSDSKRSKSVAAASSVIVIDEESLQEIPEIETKTATTTLGGAGTGVGGRFRITDTAAGDCFGSDGGRWLVGGRGGI